MTSAKKTISTIVPFFNEGRNIERIYAELKALEQRIGDRYTLEVVLVDNHSTDDSFAIASSVARLDAQAVLIRLSRNFGYQASIMTGYLHCRGDAAVQVDADGEDDPAIIETFIEKWEQGYDVVYGTRRRRAEGWHVAVLRKLFYRVITRLSSFPLPVDAGDFRLVDRKVIEHLRSFSETTLYVRGLISYIGFNQVGVSYDRRPRYDGKSKFNWWQAVRMAWHAIASFSGLPLLIVAYLGVIFSGITFVVTIAYVCFYRVLDSPPSPTLLILLVAFFLVGIQLLGMGLIGAYVGRIFEEVKQRPRSIIECVVRAEQASRLGAHSA
ncbi:MAG: glycosyltransferase family 2 protein [Deltaproteobacteria bacterium]|nr:glycosyltransferase family 2 protein [Deltaproteobacteria bacterium]